MFKGVLVGIAVTLAVGATGGYLLLRSGLIPANADGNAGPIELWVATTSLEATLAREAPKGPNPVPLTEQNLLKGVDLFARNCAVCHGSASGPASPIAKGLYPKPPQLATDGVEDDPEGFSFWRIKHGIRLTGMPSFGYSLSDSDIWTLALFLKNMDKLPPAAQKSWQNVKNWPIAAQTPTTQQ